MDPEFEQPTAWAHLDIETEPYDFRRRPHLHPMRLLIGLIRQFLSKARS
jgi:hypothetical protein